MKKTALYRYFNSDGRLLYIGISKSPIARLSQHEQYASWISELSVVTIEWFESLRGAMAAEKAAIFGERPKWNRALVSQKGLRQAKFSFISGVNKGGRSLIGLVAMTAAERKRRQRGNGPQMSKAREPLLITKLPRKKGRPLIGEVAMTGAERVRRHRERQRNGL